MPNGGGASMEYDPPRPIWEQVKALQERVEEQEKRLEGWARECERLEAKIVDLQSTLKIMKGLE
jgi:cell division protein FtsB